MMFFAIRQVHWTTVPDGGPYKGRDEPREYSEEMGILGVAMMLAHVDDRNGAVR